MSGDGTSKEGGAPGEGAGNAFTECLEELAQAAGLPLKSLKELTKPRNFDNWRRGQFFPRGSTIEQLAKTLFDQLPPDDRARRGWQDSEGLARHLDEQVRKAREEKVAERLSEPPPPPLSKAPAPLDLAALEAKLIEDIARALGAWTTAEAPEGEGPSRREHVYRNPSFFGKCRTGYHFLCERILRGAPEAGEPRTTASVVKVLIGLDRSAQSDKPDVRLSRGDHERDRRALLGNAPYCAAIPQVEKLHIELSPELRALARAGRSEPLSVDVLVVVLENDRTGTPTTQRFVPLSSLLIGAPAPVTRTQVSNVLDTAHAVALTLVCAAERGVPHGAIGNDVVLLRSKLGSYCDVMVLSYGELAARDPAEAIRTDLKAFGAFLRGLADGVKGHIPDVIERLRRLTDRYLVADLAPGERCVDRLQTFLRELDAVRVLQRQWFRRTTRNTPTIPGATTADDALAPQLFTLCRMGASWDEQCKNYCRGMPEAELSNTVLGKSKLLRLGYGSAAMRGLERLLTQKGLRRRGEGGNGLSVKRVIHALRLLVGLLLPRECRYDDALDIVRRWREIAAQRATKRQRRLLGFWLDLLEQKNLYHRWQQRRHGESGREPKDSPAFTLPSLPIIARARSAPGRAQAGSKEGKSAAASDDHEHKRRQGWLAAHRFLFRLAGNVKGKSFTAEEITDAERLVLGYSAHEACFGAIVLSRALAAQAMAAIASSPAKEQEVLSTWQRAIQAILLSATLASVRALPHEYAAALAVAAASVRRAFAQSASRGSSPRAPLLRDLLNRRGADTDECLAVAAECALRAAEIYEKLGVMERRFDALLAAAQCFFESAAPEQVAEGFQWLAYAKNARRLALSASDTRDATTEAQARFERSADRLFELGLSRWRDTMDSALGNVGSSRPPERRRAHDPGVALADEFYTIFGPGLEKLFHTGGVSVEIVGAGGPSRSDTLERLIARSPRQPGPGDSLLELGCGSGSDLRSLKGRYQLATVMGIEHSAWCIERVRQQWEGDAAGQVVQCKDITNIGALTGAPPDGFDFVLLRDSLFHVTDKLAVLRGAHRLLRPGGVLLCTDWVQRRPASREEWQILCDTAWLTDLRTIDEYREMLSAAGYRVPPAHDDRWFSDETEHMRAFFGTVVAGAQGYENRRVQRPGLPTPSEQTAFYQRAVRGLGELERLSKDGILGWVFFAVTKRDDAPARRDALTYMI